MSKSLSPQGRSSKMNGRSINPTQSTLARMIISPTSKDHKQEPVRVAVVLESTKNSKQATTRIMLLLSKLASPGLTFTPHGTLLEVKEALTGYGAAHVNSQQHLLSMLLTTAIYTYEDQGGACTPRTP